MAITGINPPPTQEPLADESSSWKRWFFAIWAAVARVIKANGDVVIGSTPGTKIFASTATNSVMGKVTLVAGFATVTNNSVTANTDIFISRQDALGTVGHLTLGRIPGVQFDIASSSPTDTGTIAYLLIEPA